MFEFGEELTIEGYGILWLIWIQILVFFLLIFLLCCFSFFTSDLPTTSTSTSTSTSTTSSSSSSSLPSTAIPISGIYQLGKPILINKHNNTTTVLKHNQVGQNQSIKGEIATSTGKRIMLEDTTGMECSSSLDADYIDYHPCNYFRLAKLAFLKCFGLDPTSENSSCSERKKERR